MSQVYGNANTCEISTVSVTHNMEHGTRYDVDHSTGCYLEYELEAGEEVPAKPLCVNVACLCFVCV